MPVEPLKRISEVPAIKKEEKVGLSQKKKQRQPKRKNKEEPGRIDIQI